MGNKSRSKPKGVGRPDIVAGCCTANMGNWRTKNPRPVSNKEARWEKRARKK